MSLLQIHLGGGTPRLPPPPPRGALVPTGRGRASRSSAGDGPFPPRGRPAAEWRSQIARRGGPGRRCPPGAGPSWLKLLVFTTAFGYVAADWDRLFLLPVDMKDWLPKGHLVWFVLDVVARLDTSALHARHPNGGPGRAGYDPVMLLGLGTGCTATGAGSRGRAQSSGWICPGAGVPAGFSKVRVEAAGGGQPECGGGQAAGDRQRRAQGAGRRDGPRVKTELVRDLASAVGGHRHVGVTGPGAGLDGRVHQGPGAVRSDG